MDNFLADYRLSLAERLREQAARQRSINPGISTEKIKQIVADQERQRIEQIVDDPEMRRQLADYVREALAQM